MESKVPSILESGAFCTAQRLCMQPVNCQVPDDLHELHLVDEESLSRWLISVLVHELHMVCES